MVVAPPPKKIRKVYLKKVRKNILQKVRKNILQKYEKNILQKYEKIRTHQCTQDEKVRKKCQKM